jgi:hypothetical protein
VVILSFIQLEVRESYAIDLMHFTEWRCVFSMCRECSRLMVDFHQQAGNGKLTGVQRKYSTSKYGYAAKTDPANFLLEARF